MSLNVNINPLNFREMRLREPQGASQFGEAIDAWKRGAARRRAERIEDEDRARRYSFEDEDRARDEEERQRKQAADNGLADMLDADKAIRDIDLEIQKLEAENAELEKLKPQTMADDFTELSFV